MRRIKRCLICKSEFQVLPSGGSRKYCFECSPTEDTVNGIMKRKTSNLLTSLLGGECGICGYDKYPISLDLHHINPSEKSFTIGGTSRPLIAKLKEARKCILICSNCHRELHANGIDIPEQSYTKIEEHIRFVTEEELRNDPNLCECGSPKTKSGKLCVPCSQKAQRTVERPSKMQLAKMVSETSFAAVGRSYGVSDNTIKKWCKSYKIPHLKSELISWYKEHS